MLPPENLWIPVTLFAAFAQTLRNAAQRNLVASLGTMGATLVRFLYGLPFALLWLAAVHHVGGFPYPSANWTFVGWIANWALTLIGFGVIVSLLLARFNSAPGS